MSIIIQNGTLILPHGPKRADLRVEGGEIAEIGDLCAGSSEVIDACGKFVFPGFIDTHTHFAGIEHLADDFATGTRAAVIGGTTSILDFATQSRGDSLTHALKRWHDYADGRCSCHYGFHMAITDWNAEVKAEIPTMTAAGVTSYKVYLAYDALRVSDADAYEIVKAVAAEGGIVGAHCENGDLVNEGIAAQKGMGNFAPAAHPHTRPDMVEGEAITRWLTIGEVAGVPVNIVHLSTCRGLEAIRAARERGQALYVESCPHYLLLDSSLYDLPAFESAKYVCSPPLRAYADNAALWAALKNGEVDTIGTDHCPFNFHEVKELGRDDFSKIPNGLPGVENRPALLYTYGVAAGRITATQMMRALAEQPAKLFGMYPQKGVLAKGSDADLVIWNQNHTGNITAARQLQHVDYTPYEGMQTVGRAETVLLSGEIVVKDGELVAENRGRYLTRAPSEFWR